MVSTAVSLRKARCPGKKTFRTKIVPRAKIQTRIRRPPFTLLGDIYPTVPKTALAEVAQLPVLRHHQPKLPVLPASPNRNREFLPGRRA